MPIIKKTLLIFVLAIFISPGGEWNIKVEAVPVSERKEEIERINQKIYETYQQMLKVEQNITTLQAEIDQLQTELQRLGEKVRIKDSFTNTNQQNSSRLYIEMVLGTDELSNFIERVDSMSVMVQADQELIEEKRELDHQKQQLEQQITRLNHLTKERSHLNDRLLEDTIHSSVSPTNMVGNSQEKDIPAVKIIDSTYIQKVITAGYQYVGNSVYVFGGGRSAEDIAKGRFDCSSFVQWAFRQAGIQIGSTTDTLKNEGRQVPLSEIQPGDLVFFDTYKKDGHVGIYIGNQRFIGSQSSTGVAVADLSFGYWKDRFNGRVVRIIK